MNYHRLKIREQYLGLIRKGYKHHEYRLATPERKEIRIGDVLVLINNQNRFDYLKVIVKNISYYSGWESALSENWKEDFKNIFSNFEDVKKECYKFYRKEEIDQYGIEVFEIEPFVPELKESNVLLDTNIVIHRESSNSIAYEVIQLYKSLDKLKANKYIVEDIKEEIKKYKDKNVVNNMLAKIESYYCLETKDIKDPFFINITSRFSNDDNSRIDNLFLYQIYIGRVDFFVTDDKGILQKAKELLLDDCVLSTSDFLGLIEKRYPTLINYKALSVNLCRISALNINENFFDTLREDYGGLKFNRWFEKKAKDGEQAYIFKNKNGLQGFLYLKIENEQESYADIRSN